MRFPALFWRVQRRVVDRARGVVSRWQDIPRPTAEQSGPLLLAGAMFPLDVVAAHPLVQPDATSCGSSTLVMLRMLRSPAYAAEVLGATDRDAAFARAALAVRRRTNALRDARGRLQLPWPASLGTRPAAMIRLLESPAGFGDPRLRYHNVVIDPADPDPLYDAIVASVRAGEPVPLYIGDHRWMQHIVLVVRADDDQIGVYDPAIGRGAGFTRDEFRRGELRVAGWRRPWLAILGSPSAKVS